MHRNNQMHAPMRAKFITNEPNPSSSHYFYDKVSKWAQNKNKRAISLPLSHCIETIPSGIYPMHALMKAQTLSPSLSLH